MLSEYRLRYEAFHTQLNREEYLFRAGLKAQRETAHVLSEHSDLYTLAAIDGLRAALAETAAYRETERTAIRRLIAFAVHGRAAAGVREVTAELDAYELRARMDWHGARLSLHEAGDAMARAADPPRRRELHARRADLIAGAQDLRAERWAHLHAAARSFGHENHLALRRELDGCDYERTAKRANAILSQTESRYVTALAPLLARAAGVPLDEATEAELGRLRRFTDFDYFFAPEQMPTIYAELFAGFGFNTETQANLRVDSEPRARKESRAFCAPIRVPDEIKLVVNFAGGQANYREFLHTAGRAQHCAWTSHELHPELRRGGDESLAAGWGLLLESLMRDEHWLAGTFGLIEGRRFRHPLAVLRLMKVRRCAALLNYEVEFHAGKLGGGAGERYAERLTDAVRVRVEPPEHLRELSDSFRPAAFLRGCAFEVQLRDHLKTRFGTRWWAAHKAGELLIDWWNTGRRYSVEELAALIGLGELSFDCLADELLEQVA